MFGVLRLPNRSGILQVVHTEDYLVVRGTGIYSSRSRSQVYDSFLGEFLMSHGDTVDDEHCFSSIDGHSVKDDHSDIRGHATGMCP